MPDARSQLVRLSQARVKEELNRFAIFQEVMELVQGDGSALQPIRFPSGQDQRAAQPGQQEQSQDGNGRTGAEPRMASRPLTQPLAQRWLTRVTKRQVIQMSFNVFLKLTSFLVAP